MKKVVQVLPRKDFKVYVYFYDGKIKLYDMADVIGKGVFSKIKNIDDFLEKCTVINNTLAWDIDGNFSEYTCIDIDPNVIYAEGLDVSDPLSEREAS